MSKARVSALYATTAFACVAISCPAIAQSPASAGAAPRPPAPQPNLGAPTETTVESDKVSQGVAQAPADQSVLRADYRHRAKAPREDPGRRNLDHRAVGRDDQDPQPHQHAADQPAGPEPRSLGLDPGVHDLQPARHFPEQLPGQSRGAGRRLSGRSLRRQHERARACRSSTSSGSRCSAVRKAPCSAAMPRAD